MTLPVRAVEREEAKEPEMDETVEPNSNTETATQLTFTGRPPKGKVRHPYQVALNVEERKLFEEDFYRFRGQAEHISKTDLFRLAWKQMRTHHREEFDRLILTTTDTKRYQRFKEYEEE